NTHIYDGILRAVSGDNGRVLWSASDPADRLWYGSAVAVADIDGDGKPEIIATDYSHHLIAFEHDGQVKWISQVPLNTSMEAPVAIADLDHDGSPEIVIGATVLNAD